VSVFGIARRRGIHNLRHAHGSYLLQRGVSIKVVQARLGHASAQFTLGTYAHVLPGMQEPAAREPSGERVNRLHLHCTSRRTEARHGNSWKIRAGAS